MNGIRQALVRGIVRLAMPLARPGVWLALWSALWLAPASGGAYAAAPAPLVLEGRQASYALQGHVAAFHDPTGRMDRAAVGAADRDGAFRPVAGGFDPGIDNDGAWWLRFDLAAGPGGDGVWWLSVDAHPLTAEVDAFVPEPAAGGGVAMAWRRSGLTVPMAARDLPVPLFVFRMEMPAGESRTVYVRLAGTRTIRALLDVQRLPALTGRLTALATGLSLILGSAALLAAAAIACGVWLRARTLTMLGAGTALMTALQLLVTGLALPALDGLSTGAVYALHSLLLNLTCAAMILTALTMFGGFRAMPWSRRAMLGLLGFTLFGVLTSPLDLHATLLPGLIAVMMAFSVLAVIAAFRSLRAGEPAGRWYLAGFLVYGAMLNIYAGLLFGLVPLNVFSIWISPVLLVVQVAILFAGMLTAVRSTQDARLALEAALLAASRSNERTLERAVADRTRALQEENEARGVAETALRRALREQRNLLAMVSHEFRTPLAAIGAAVHVIRAGAPAAPRERQELDKIGRAASRLGGLIDTFLTDEWLDRATLQLKPRRFDLTALLADLARDVRAGDGRLVTLDAPPSLIVEADAMLLRIAVGNLIGNALKYTRGSVRIAAAQDNGLTTIRVGDDGPGLDAGDREAVFERYYRSEAHARLPGAGLGLFIVRRIAERHGGSIGVESTPSAGSTFCLVLPLQAPAA